MKSLSGMTSGQPRSVGEGNARSSNRAQVIRSCLPIAVTALLVIFLGGFPPTTWVLLFQTFGQLNALLTYKGPEVILPLMILIVQSLLLVVAWVLLGWVMLREGTHIMTMQSKAELDRLLAFQSANGELINLSQIVSKQLPLEQDFDEATDTFEEEQDFDEAASSLKEEEPEEDSWASRSVHSRSVQSRSMPSRSVESKSSRSRDVQPRTVQSSRAQSRDMQSRTVQPSRAQSRDVQPRTVQPSRAQSRDVQPRNAQSSRAQSRDVQPRNAQSSRVQSRDVQPRDAQSSRVEPDDVQSRNLKSRNLQSHRTLSSRRGLSTGRLPEEELLENPFEEELSSTSKTDDNVKQNRTRMVTKKEQLLEEENEDDDDDPFVYGNPFDGPLPEVFKYDTDLRRSVQELREEEAAQSNGSKAKGSGAQKAKRS
jgi:hypothetical protein